MIPSNMSDAVSAARDGELGLLEQVKIGDLLVSALLTLYVPSTKSITRKPMAENFAITDAVVDEPLEMSLDICLANPSYGVGALTDAAMTGSVESLTQTWRDKKKELYTMFNENEIVKVQTHENVYTNMIITSIDPQYNLGNNMDAFFANVYLTQIKKLSSGSEGGLKDQAKGKVKA